jgi:hypothetical protein
MSSLSTWQPAILSPASHCLPMAEKFLLTDGTSPLSDPAAYRVCYRPYPPAVRPHCKAPESAVSVMEARALKIRWFPVVD